MRRDNIMKMGRLAGQVLRWHTWPVIRQQSVGEHTWQVLRIYIQIWGPPSPEVTVYIVAHDAGEFHAGDLPWSSKKNDPMIKEIMDRKEEQGRLTIGLCSTDVSEVEKRRVKLCDVLELWEFGLTEVAMGNRFADCIIQDPLTYIHQELLLGMSLDDLRLVNNYMKNVRGQFNARDHRA